MAAFCHLLSRLAHRADHPTIVLVLAGWATGVLAPILLGLPIGMLVQFLNGAEPDLESGLASWVFAVVYSGFGLLAAAMAVLLVVHVGQRWTTLIATVPIPSRRIAMVGSLGLVPFSAAMLFWGLAGPGSTGPQGMDSPAQRTVLAVAGALSAAAFILPATTLSRRHPRGAWLIIWTGTCIAALQGPTQVLLAQGGQVQPVVAIIALTATPGAVAYGIGLLRRRHPPSAH